MSENSATTYNFMELPIQINAAAQAYHAYDNIAQAFGEGSLTYYKTIQRIRTGVQLAPLAGALIQEAAAGSQQLSPVDVQPYITLAAPLMPHQANRMALTFNSGDLASSVVLGAARGALQSNDVKRTVSGYLQKAEPYIDSLTAGERGPKRQLEAEADHLLGTIQNAARQAAAQRRKSEGKYKLRDPARPDRYVRREDVAVGIKSAVEAILAQDAQLPLISGLAAEALGHTGLTKTEILQLLRPETTKAIAYTLVSALNIILPPEQRYHTLQHIAGQFSKEAFVASILPAKGVAKKFNALRDNLPNLIKNLHNLLPETNDQLRLPYERMRKVFAVSPAVGSITLHAN